MEERGDDESDIKAQVLRKCRPSWWWWYWCASGGDIDEIVGIGD
jgi:hypothetical protein